MQKMLSLYLLLSLCALNAFAESYELDCNEGFTCTSGVTDGKCRITPHDSFDLKSFTDKQSFLDKMLFHNKKYISFSQELQNVLKIQNNEDKFLELTALLDANDEFSNFEEAILFKLSELDLSLKEIELVHSVFFSY